VAHSPSVSAVFPALAAPARPRQNWVLDPFQDLLLIILAPVLSLGLALLAMAHYGAERGAALVITAHIVLTVAHHLPTFIRIYGDVDLFRRFKWSFILGPVIPLAFVTAMLVYINVHDYPVETILYLYIFLALWDPWHFLRQHFGFTRIYDRNNAAPVRLASNMDWWLCAIWFVHIMVASATWIPSLLEDLYRNARIPLLFALSPGLLSGAQVLTGTLTALMTLVYAGYLLWCRQRGYYVSPAKLGLLICTFGVMYLTYTPNDFILQLAPAWGFKVGFATVGIVHMTQYLAIVWRYDQRLAQNGRARRGWFTWLHARRSRWALGLAALGYVLFCVAYGDTLTTSHDSRLLMSVLLAIGFTSTLMHYYFDGFIWKVRHQQNREALDLQQPATAPGLSWWSSTATTPALRVLGRQLLYFALPLGILTVGAVKVWSADRTNYAQYMLQAQRLGQQGRDGEAVDAARKAYARMRAELPYLRQMATLQPSAAHEAELAFLVYNEALYEYRVIPMVEGRPTGPRERQALARGAGEAAALLYGALERGGPVAHGGRENLDPADARSIALSWERQAR
jgi:hypothetical protein